MKKRCIFFQYFLGQGKNSMKTSYSISAQLKFMLEQEKIGFWLLLKYDQGQRHMITWQLLYDSFKEKQLTGRGKNAVLIKGKV